MSLENNYLKTFLIIIGVVLLLMAPDYIYASYNESYYINRVVRLLPFLTLLSTSLVLNKVKWLSNFLLILFCVLQLMQFARLDYFGRPLNQYDFALMFAEKEDVMLGIQDALATHWKVLPTVIVPFVLIWLLLKIKMTTPKWGTILLPLTCMGIFLIHSLNVTTMYPVEGRLFLSNTFKSSSIALSLLFRNYQPPVYEDYEIKNVGIPYEDPITIVCIIGESSNASHMPLFGYERETTPNLERLSKEPNFYYTEGIAAGTCTRASVRFMTHVIWEPNNVKLNNSGKTSLFKLAKENGFKTFYLASTSENMVNIMCGFASKYIDVCRTKSNDLKRMAKLMDDYMLALIDEQKFEDRNFIVLHQRCIHTPYSKCFPEDYKDREHFKNGATKSIDEYDNAMRYNDTFISRVFNKFNKQKKGKFYIIFASDHNELHGEHGVYGHGTLIPECADIPVIVQSNDEKFMDKFRSIYKPTHHEIATMVSELLGYKIINPNQKENIFHINATDYDGHDGYITLTKDPIKRTVSYEIHR